jgi:hypothetical protein
MDPAYQFEKQSPFTAWSMVPMDQSITLPRQSALAAAGTDRRRSERSVQFHPPLYPIRRTISIQLAAKEVVADRFWREKRPFVVWAN